MLESSFEIGKDRTVELCETLVACLSSVHTRKGFARNSAVRDCLTAGVRTCTRHVSRRPINQSAAAKETQSLPLRLRDQRRKPALIVYNECRFNLTAHFAG